MKPLILSLLLAGSLTALNAHADARNFERTPGTRLASQSQRIEQGWKRGDLTGAETRRLGREQREIRQERRQYAADGHIDRAERADLRRDLNESGRHIYNERQDGERSGWQAHDNGRHLGWTQGRHTGWSEDRGQARFDGRRDGRGGEWIDREQRQQREMLERGVRSGRITPEEFRRLSAQQHTIRAEERSYRSDGRLNGAERADLRQDLALAWRNIRNEIYDGERRYR